MVHQINRNKIQDWKQLYVELDRLNLKKQPTPTLDDKSSCKLLYFNYKHNDISSEVASLLKNWDNLGKSIESERLVLIRKTLDGSIKYYLNQLLGNDGPDYLLAIRNCFDVSYSTNIILEKDNLTHFFVLNHVFYSATQKKLQVK